MTPRISPATAPFSPKVQAAFDAILPPGMKPLTLFTTLARDERLLRKFFAGSLLDEGHLSLRQREIVIDRTAARCRSEYEWGIHIALFGARANLTEEQIRSLALGDASDACWSEEERTLIQLCDELHEQVTVTDATWEQLRHSFSDEAILELLLLAGFYRTVGYLTNALKLPLEPQATTFPEAAR